MLITGVLATGAAFAAPGGTKMDQKLEDAVKSGKLSQGEADVMRQIGELRQNYKSQVQSLLDQAVKDGKINQEQAGKLMHHGRHGRMLMKHLTQEELKAKLDEAVKSGRMTREQADKVLEHHAQHHRKQ